MSFKLQVIIFLVLVLSSVILIALIRKNKLDLKYAISWLFMGCGIFILTLFPSLMVFLANQLGIASATNMLFFLGFGFSLVVIFSLTMAISRLSSKIEKLTQELALYKKEQANEKSIK